MSRVTSALSDKTDKRLFCKVKCSTQNAHIHTYTQAVVCDSLHGPLSSLRLEMGN